VERCDLAKLIDSCRGEDGHTLVPVAGTQASKLGRGEWIDQRPGGRGGGGRSIDGGYASPLHTSSTERASIIMFKGQSHLRTYYIRHQLTGSATYTSSLPAMPPKLSSQPLTADAKRLRTIIISFPLFVATSWILYKRGENRVILVVAVTLLEGYR
jgi:hypothetical protein